MLREARGTCESQICWAKNPDPRGEEPFQLEKVNFVKQFPTLGKGGCNRWSENTGIAKISLNPSPHPQSWHTTTKSE